MHVSTKRTHAERGYRLSQSSARRWVRLLSGVVSAFARSKPQKTDTRKLRSTSNSTQPTDASPGQFGAGATRDLTPDEIRGLRPSYAPGRDGSPDPGEVVWTWVPYVENDGRGKDRPVLIIARVGADAWAACYLSTKQHRGFISLGSGSWDSKGRESFLSPERVLRVTEAGMRREAAEVEQRVFELAAAGVLKYHRVS